MAPLKKRGSQNPEGSKILLGNNSLDDLTQWSWATTGLQWTPHFGTRYSSTWWIKKTLDPFQSWLWPGYGTKTILVDNYMWHEGLFFPHTMLTWGGGGEDYCMKQSHTVWKSVSIYAIESCISLFVQVLLYQYLHPRRHHSSKALLLATGWAEHPPGKKYKTNLHTFILEPASSAY